MPDRSLLGGPSSGQPPPNTCSGRILRNFGRHVARPLLDLLFPPVCSLCGACPGDPPSDAALCDGCQREVARWDWDRPPCPRCARPLPKGAVPDETSCPQCVRRRSRLDRTFALGQYKGPMRDAVLRVKRPHEEPLTLALGRLLADRLRDTMADKTRRVIVPVPMHWTRRLIRGVNGPELLAEVLSSRLGIPTKASLVRCRRRTRKQGTLQPTQRRSNVRGAYGTRGGDVAGGARVLLVDDVVTTGATANEIARVLRRAGAVEVSLAVLARGVGFD